MDMFLGLLGCLAVLASLYAGFGLGFLATKWLGEPWSGIGTVLGGLAGFALSLRIANLVWRGEFLATLEGVFSAVQQTGTLPLLLALVGLGLGAILMHAIGPVLEKVLISRTLVRWEFLLAFGTADCTSPRVTGRLDALRAAAERGGRRAQQRFNRARGTFEQEMFFSCCNQPVRL